LPIKKDHCIIFETFEFSQSVYVISLAGFGSRLKLKVELGIILDCPQLGNHCMLASKYSNLAVFTK